MKRDNYIEIWRESTPSSKTWRSERPVLLLKNRKESSALGAEGGSESER